MSFVGEFNYLESIFFSLIGFYITCFLNLVTCLIRSEKLKLYLSELGELDCFVSGSVGFLLLCVGARMFGLVHVLTL